MNETYKKLHIVIYTKVLTSITGGVQFKGYMNVLTGVDPVVVSMTYNNVYSIVYGNLRIGGRNGILDSMRNLMI